MKATGCGEDNFCFWMDYTLILGICQVLFLIIQKLYELGLTPAGAFRPYNFRAEEISFFSFPKMEKRKSLQKEKRFIFGPGGEPGPSFITAVRLPRWWSIPMVPFISARYVDALSQRLTRLAAHRSINRAFVPLSGRAGAVGNVWCSKKTFLFPYGPDTRPARVSNS